MAISCVAPGNKPEENMGIGKVSNNPLKLPSFMEFLGSSQNRQIFIRLHEEDSQRFNYKLEILKNWRFVSIDTGVVHIEAVASDTIFILKGGSLSCDFAMNVHMPRDVGSYETATIERKCRDHSMNIKLEDFQWLWNKVGKQRSPEFH
jgi:hypothetical protein